MKIEVLLKGNTTIQEAKEIAEYIDRDSISADYFEPIKSVKIVK